MNKSKLTIGAALLLAGILIVTSLPKAGAQSQNKPQHGIVLLEAQEYLNVTDQGTTNAMYAYAGFYVYNIDTSPGVPKLAVITPQPYSWGVTTNQLAPVLAEYLALGFTITHTDGRLWTLQN